MAIVSLALFSIKSQTNQGCGVFFLQSRFEAFFWCRRQFWGRWSLHNLDEDLCPSVLTPSFFEWWKHPAKENPWDNRSFNVTNIFPVRRTTHICSSLHWRWWKIDHWPSCFLLCVCVKESFLMSPSRSTSMRPSFLLDTKWWTRWGHIRLSRSSRQPSPSLLNRPPSYFHDCQVPQETQ